MALKNAEEPIHQINLPTQFVFAVCKRGRKNYSSATVLGFTREADLREHGLGTGKRAHPLKVNPMPGSSNESRKLQIVRPIRHHDQRSPGLGRAPTIDEAEQNEPGKKLSLLNAEHRILE